MLARVASFAIEGLEPLPVTVEVDIRGGLPAFQVVGLADAAVREARERARVAVLNSGFEFPQRRITANLAPAHLRKIGPGFDLALAVGILAASGQLGEGSLDGWAVHGELSLTGELRPCRGVLAVAEGARRAGLRGLVLPRASAVEAALVPGIVIGAVDTLRDVVGLLAGDLQPEPVRAEPGHERFGPVHLDLADVRGQAAALRALEVAAAGGHNLLMQGPPGTGKTMLARRLPGILPPLRPDEALEVTRIQSIAGIKAHGGLVLERPFRAPHHATSAAGLVGGGSRPRPGEVTLAHHGVLFLDELSEFPRPSLEALRQPLEDGSVMIVRGQRSLRFPTRFMLVAATNPCPCGYAGSPGRRCTCTEAERARYEQRLSGPLLDRIDLQVFVRRPTAAELAAPPTTSSAEVRARVIAARERQTARLDGSGVACNAQLDPAQVRRLVRLTASAQRTLLELYERSTMSARAHHRIVRVAQTIADLAGADVVDRPEILQAYSAHLRPATPMEMAA
jgi:magnesium chelatase family protein